MKLKFISPDERSRTCPAGIVATVRKGSAVYHMERTDISRGIAMSITAVAGEDRR
jgi:hypothetical protein